jgi:two-component system response regulator AtoC
MMNALPNVIPFNETPPAEHDRPQSIAPPAELRFTLSPTMDELHKQVERVAQVDVPVLLLGESGVGKEFIARSLHTRSLRCRGTFLKVNCAALPSALLESELFGYEAGAFTGAVKSKPGQFELCDHGTILLDEIGEMPSALQAKLLHVIEDQQFSRLGGRRVITVDVRILAATNIDIEKALQNKTFRPDLYYRLNAITLRIPPLRERREDIPLFVNHFMSQLPEKLGCPAKPFPKRIMNACLRYSWPGNVRELKNFMCRYLILQDDETAIASILNHDSGADGQPDVQPGLRPLVQSVRAEAERRLIQECLTKARWNRTETARALHISTKTLWNKMRQYGIRYSSFQGEAANDEATRCFSNVAAGTRRAAGQGRRPIEGRVLDRVGTISRLGMANRAACSGRPIAQ